MPEATWGTWKDAAFTEVDSESHEMKRGNYYVFKRENVVGTVLGFLSPDAASAALLDTERIKRDFLAAYKNETGEDGQIEYIYVKYDNMAGAGYSRWIFNGVTIVVEIKDVGFALTAAVIIALTVMFAVIALTLTGVWLVFEGLNVIPKPLEWVWILLVLAALFVLAVIFMGKGKLKVSKGSVKTG